MTINSQWHAWVLTFKYIILDRFTCALTNFIYKQRITNIKKTPLSYTAMDSIFILIVAFGKQNQIETAEKRNRRRITIARSSNGFAIFLYRQNGFNKTGTHAINAAPLLVLSPSFWTHVHSENVPIFHQKIIIIIASHEDEMNDKYNDK